MASNAPTSTSSEPPDITLITVNLDVQSYIISFLPIPDLSTLMRTCKHFLDVCLLPLCALPRIILHECDFRRVPSFRRFLRIHAGSSSRAHLIKDLWIAVSDIQLSVEYDTVEMLRNAEEWSPAFLDILRHCHNLQLLRIDRWFMGEVPFPLLMLMDTITSSLHHLEDLSICMPDEADVDILGRLTLLPTLRRLSFLRRDGFNDNTPLTPVSLECLPRSLAELDIDLGAPTNTPFPLVRKLGVRGTRLPIQTFVADATTAFPNVIELILRRHGVSPLYFTMPGIVDGARPLSKLEWRKRSSKHGDSVWPSLSTIWAEDLCQLYCLGFPRHVSSISIPFRRRSEERYLAPVLADASPSFVELRVNMDDGFLTFSSDWRSYFGPSVSSAVRLTMLHHTARDHSVRFSGWNGDLEKAVLDTLCGMLPAFTGLAYLRIRFVLRYTPLRLERLDGRDIRAIANVIRKRDIARLAQASRSLRWIALEVYDLGLECWEVSRVPEGQAVQGSPVCTKTSELAGWAVLKREGMDAFKDVRPSLDIIRY